MSSTWKIMVPLLALFFVVVSSETMVGGASPADQNSPLVKDALKFAVAQYNRESNAMYVSKMTKVIKAQQQVVTGMMYTFTVEMSKTACTKREDPTDKPCPVHTDAAIAAPEMCTFKVWSRPWIPSLKLVQNTCQ